MRKRYGAASGDNGGKSAPASAEAAVDEPDRSGWDAAPVKREISRLEVIAAAATLTLGIIRVIREATDLYRKVFPAAGGGGMR